MFVIFGDNVEDRSTQHVPRLYILADLVQPSHNWYSARIEHSNLGRAHSRIWRTS
jgi:hypothetical protein